MVYWSSPKFSSSKIPQKAWLASITGHLHMTIIFVTCKDEMQPLRQSPYSHFARPYPILRVALTDPRFTDKHHPDNQSGKVRIVLLRLTTPLNSFFMAPVVECDISWSNFNVLIKCRLFLHQMLLGAQVIGCSRAICDTISHASHMCNTLGKECL